MREELEEQLKKVEREKEELLEEVQTLQHQRDQRLLQAESEKQQVGFGVAQQRRGSGLDEY